MKNQKGITLLLAIIVISIVLSIGLNLSVITTKELGFARLASDSIKAHYAAESALECAVYWMFKETDYFPISQTRNISCNGEIIVVGGSDTSRIELGGGTDQFGVVTVYRTPPVDERNFTLSSEGFNRDLGAEGDASTVQQELRAASIQKSSKSDLIFVMDRSSSLDAEETAQLKEASIAFMDAINIGPDTAHIGIVVFDTNARLEQELTDDTVAIETAINTDFGGGLTNIGDALIVATDELESARDRNDAEVPDIVIFLSDGLPNRPLDPVTGNQNQEYARQYGLDAADAARSKGIEVYSVAIGTNAAWWYLEQIADDDNHFYTASGFDVLDEVLEDIAGSFFQLQRF